MKLAFMYPFNSFISVMFIFLPMFLPPPPFFSNAAIAYFAFINCSVPFIDLIISIYLDYSANAFYPTNPGIPLSWL
jgi:hypothetical protein